MRPIDADLLLKLPFLRDNYFNREKGNRYYISAWETFKEWVEIQPTLEGVYSHSGWSKVSDGNSKWLVQCSGESAITAVCPSCETWHTYQRGYMPNYCPNCGEKMVEE